MAGKDAKTIARELREYAEGLLRLADEIDPPPPKRGRPRKDAS